MFKSLINLLGFGSGSDPEPLEEMSDVEFHITNLTTDITTVVEPNLEAKGVWENTIGSSSNCWITLPDLSLPDIAARVRFVGHHHFLLVIKPDHPANFDNNDNYDECMIGLLNHRIRNFWVQSRLKPV